MSEENYIVNEGKNEIIEVDGVKYQRLAIRTHVITDQDDVCDVIDWGWTSRRPGRRCPGAAGRFHPEFPLPIPILQNSP